VDTVDVAVRAREAVRVLRAVRLDRRLLAERVLAERAVLRAVLAALLLAERVVLRAVLAALLVAERVLLRGVLRRLDAVRPPLVLLVVAIYLSLQCRLVRHDVTEHMFVHRGVEWVTGMAAKGSSGAGERRLPRAVG
jgi:hypothetical protein